MSIPRFDDVIDVPRMRSYRVERAREQMKKDGIGAYLCFLQENIKYLTDTYTYMVSAANYLARNVLFPRTGDPILYERGYRYKRVRDETAPWLKGNVRPGWNLPRYLNEGIRPQEFLDDLKKTLAEYDLLNEPLGVDMPILSVGFIDMLRSEGIKAVDGGRSLERARALKNIDEVNCFRQSIVICDEIFAKLREAIRPGVRECELAGMIERTAMEREVDGPCDVLACSGENTFPNAMGFSDRIIRPGDIIFFDLPGVSWRGYRSCVYRTFVCGRATQKQKEIYAETRRLLYAAKDKLKAGATTADVCKAWPGPEHWGGKSWREVSDCAVGHGEGLTGQDWPTITPLFSLEHPVTLEENMLIALETYYCTDAPPFMGCRIENDHLITKDGCEILTKFPEEEIIECWV